jgi:hypothetical protein
MSRGFQPGLLLSNFPFTVTITHRLSRAHTVSPCAPSPAFKFYVCILVVIYPYLNTSQSIIQVGVCSQLSAVTTRYDSLSCLLDPAHPPCSMSSTASSFSRTTIPHHTDLRQPSPTALAPKLAITAPPLRRLRPTPAQTLGKTPPPPIGAVYHHYHRRIPTAVDHGAAAAWWSSGSAS